MADSVRCESCGRHADRPDAFGPGLPVWWRPLPGGWLRVFVVEAGSTALGPDRYPEVCGWACAADAVLELKALAGLAAAGAGA